MNNVIATLVAVVVTLLLIVVAVVIGQQLFTGGNAQKAVSEIQALNQAARSLLVGQNVWGNQDLTAALASSGLAPADMVSGTSLYDPWGGTVEIYSQPPGLCTGPPGNTNCIAMAFFNIPNSACAQIVSSLPVGCNEGVVGVVNGNVGNSSTCGPGLTPAWAASVCTGNNNEVWVNYAS